MGHKELRLGGANMTECHKTDGIPDSPAVSRRDVLGGGTVIAAAAMCSDAFAPALAAGKAQPAPLTVTPSHALMLRTTVNGRPLTAEIDSRTSLLDLLR